MHYLVLTTGSCGNCYVFNENDETIIIDCGVTYKKLSEQLSSHDIPLESVKALFLTHLHPDHAKGVGPFMRKTKKPVYLSDRSYKECKLEIAKQKIDYEDLKTFMHGETVKIGSFEITPFKTSHDSIGSSGYFIETKSATVFLMTDTGLVPDGAFSYARDAKVMFIESNYDDYMLEHGPYSAALIRRVKGPYGHLSNHEAVDFAKRTARYGDSVYFVHISANNNTPEIVRALATSEIESGIFLRVLERGEMIEGFIDE